MKFLVIINLKSYREALFENFLKIEKEIRKIQNKNLEFILCPNALDLNYVQKIKTKCFAQHIDNLNYGPFTGKIVANSIKKLKLKGALISHSEDLDKIDEIKKKILISKKLKLKSCVCVRNIKTAKIILKLKPDFLAYEPKELIGTKTSVLTKKSELKALLKLKTKTKILIGAGIKNKQDIIDSKNLGFKGILISSIIAKSKNLKKTINQLFSF